jgi:S-DNA-T family DNA segregation ATPase FtsK/SpoIIIE
VSTTLTPEGTGSSVTSLRVDHFDPASDAWQTETVPAGDPSFTVTDSVTVPANGTQVLKLRLSPGTAAAADVKVAAAANGALAVATVPVTGPAFQASGLTAVARAGAPALLTGKLTNPTDVGLQDVPVKLVLCSAGSAGCVAHASDVKVEVLIGAAWHVVPLSADAAGSMMTATVVPDLALPAGGTAQVSVRVTVGPGAFGGQGQTSGPGQTSGTPSGPSTSQPPAQPIAVPLALGPVGLTLVGQPTLSGTLTVQPPPQPAPTTPTTPSSTPTSSAATGTPTPTDSATTAGTPTVAPTDSAPTDPASSAEAASTPGAASSAGNPTILVAAGLLAVCLALVLWWVLMKHRERAAQAHAAAGPVQHGEHADETED